MRFARHISYAFVKPRIAERNSGIAAVQELIYLFAFFKPCKRAVLPQNGRGVRQSAFKTIMTAHKRAIAQFQTIIEYFPELLLVAARRKSHVHKVYRYYPLIESAVILGLAVFVDVRR